VLDDAGHVRQELRVTHRLIVGREETSDVVLAEDTVSRHHARIEWNGQVVLVQDLDSRNGTWLGGERLIAHQPRHWTQAESLRIGSHVLRLSTGQPHPKQPHPAGQAHPAGPAAGVVGVRLAIDPPALTLVPGQLMQARITLTNAGNLVDHLTMTVDGVSSTWVRFGPTDVPLLPGDAATINLSIQVPRSPEAVAGEYPVTLGAQSRADPASSASLKTTWTVAPFAGAFLELMPAHGHGRTGASYAVQLVNEGNAPASYRLAVHNDDQRLKFRLTPDTLEVPPGKSRSAQLMVGAQARLFGREILHTLTIQAEGVIGQVPRLSTTGQFAHEPMGCGCLAFLGVFAGLLALGGVVVAQEPLRKWRS
jgi:hypothetical protein